MPRKKKAPAFKCQCPKPRTRVECCTPAGETHRCLICGTSAVLPATREPAALADISTR